MAKIKKFEQIPQAAKLIFNSPDGEKLLEYLQSQFYVYHSTFEHGATDPYYLAYKEGQRSGVHFLEHLTQMDEIRQEFSE